MSDQDVVKRRTHSQKIGDVGEAFVRAWVEEASGWIARAQEKDFGIDLELELDDRGVRGELIKVQVRTTEGTKPDACMTVPVEQKLLAYADECRVPVAVVGVDLARSAAYYCWLQGWLLTDEGQRVRSERIATHGLAIPRDKELRHGLGGELRDIARHRMPEQLWLGMRDVLRSAVALGDARSSRLLAELLASVRGYAQRPIRELVDEVMALGSRIWATDEGNRVSRVLYGVCRALGGEFTTEDVRRLVVRGAGYSRTGVNALGVMYDDHSEHMASLGLPRAFEADDPRVRYYCLLRERYLGRASSTLLSSGTDFDIEELTVDPDVRDDLPKKWANRGDSAILDYVIARAR